MYKLKHTQKQKLVFTTAAAMVCTLLMSATPAVSEVSGALIYSYNDVHDGYSEHHIHITDLGQGEDRVISPADGAAWNATFNPDGSVVYTLLQNDEAQIFITGAAGENTKQITHEAGLIAFHPMMSPDGKTIVFTHWNEAAIAMVDVHSGSVKVIASSNARDHHPVFFSDGKRILFESRRIENDQGDPGLFIYHIKTGDVYHTGFFGHYARPSHDGTRIVFSGSKNEGDEPDVYVADLSSDDTARRLTDQPFYEGHPTFAKDDRAIIYVSRAAQDPAFPREDESDTAGVNEVFIMNVDGTEKRRLTHGEAVAWHPELQ